MSGLLAVVLVLVGVTAGQPFVTLLGVFATGVAFAQRWLPLDASLPAGVAAVLLGAVVVGLAADALGVDVLSVPWVTSSVLLILALASVVLPAARRRELVHHSDTSGGLSGGDWWAFLPAVAPLVSALLLAIDQTRATVWAVATTDVPAHLGLLQELQLAGALDYGKQAYPRAVHMVVAVVTGPGAPVDDPFQLLPYDASLWEGITWGSLALMLVTLTALFLRLSAIFKLPRVVARVAAVVMSAVLLWWPDLSASHVVFGAAASFIAITVILGLVLAVLARPDLGSRPALALLVPAWLIALIAHLWQALAAAPAVACVLWLLGSPLAGKGARVIWARLTPLAWFGVGIGLLLALVVAVAPLRAVVSTGGTGLAATFGLLPSVPTYIGVTVVLLAGVLLVRRWPMPWARAYVGALVGLTLAVVVLLVGASGGFNLAQWYPAKAFWALTLVAVPAGWAAGTLIVSWAFAAAWSGLSRLGAAARVARVSLIALLVLWAGAVVAGWAVAYRPAVVASWEASGTPRIYDIAVSTSRDLESSVIVAASVGTGGGDYAADVTYARLVAFLKAQPALVGGPTSVCGVVQEGMELGRVVVVTSLDVTIVRDVLAAQGCASTEVVRVAGRVADPGSDLGRIAWINELRRATDLEGTSS